MRYSSKHRNGGAKGHGEVAGEANSAVPNAPPTTFAEGQGSCADEASPRPPSANDGEGHGVFAQTANPSAPSPSQVHDDGHTTIADNAIGRTPSSESGEMGQSISADKAGGNLPISPLLSQLAELQVRRKFYIGAVNKQTNAVKALVRRSLGWRYDDEGKEAVNKRATGIVTATLAGKEVKPEDAAVAYGFAGTLAIVGQAIEPMQKARDETEKDMKRLARQLPVYEWAKDVKGFGELGLAVIVAEAGDIGSYPKKGHLWKRLGLAPFRDKAMSSWRREGGLSSDEWVVAGYSPRRRAEIYAVIGDPLFRAQSVAKGPYREIYDRRRARTAETHPDWTKAHSHADGLRVMTKHLVRDLRVAWRRVGQDALKWAGPHLPAANIYRSEAIAVVPQIAVSASAPSSEPLEQEASDAALHRAANKSAPTAQPSRRKAGISTPQFAAVHPLPTGDPIEREAVPDAPRPAEEPQPTARPHTKRRKASPAVLHAMPALPT